MEAAHSSEKAEVKTDASGNKVLRDIGKHLAGEIKDHFETAHEPVDLKYIDPTYMVRAIPTIPSDHIYCTVLGQNAVHAAFAGFTGAAPTSGATGKRNDAMRHAVLLDISPNT